MRFSMLALIAVFSFSMRALIAVFSGVGAGTVGFALAWLLDQRVLFLNPGAGSRDALFVSSIFVPGMLVALLVFRAVSLAVTRRTA